MLKVSASLQDAVNQAQTRRQTLSLRMVHIGFGAFFRAHQAWCTNELVKQNLCDWGYCVVNLGPASVLESLAQQRYLYTVTQRGESRTQTEVIGVIHSAMSDAQQGVAAIIQQLCDPQIEIVSLTVTEKGYFFSAADGQLTTAHPDIAHDIHSPHQPRSLLGILLESMSQRQQAGLAPLTLLSCDNIAHNGARLKASLEQLAHHQHRPAALVRSLLNDYRFPSTMVDRIVPAMTEESRAWLAQHIDGEDEVGVLCEPFFQWVIEDNFAAGRPRWELAGVTFTDTIEPWEEMKLRMLNGSHSFLAYVGWLAGYQTIYDCMQDPELKWACQHFMCVEQAPTLSIEGVDLYDYSQQLIARFSNPEIKHTTRQIASDGSLKIPQRWLQGLAWQAKHSCHYELLALGIAAWCRYLWGVDEQGHHNEVVDPHYPELKRCLQNHDSSAQHIVELVNNQQIFPAEFSQIPGIVALIQDYYLRLQQFGAKQTLHQVMAQIVQKKDSQ